MLCKFTDYLQKNIFVLPWLDAQPCRSPAMAVKRCV